MEITRRSFLFSSAALVASACGSEENLTAYYVLVHLMGHDLRCESGEFVHTETKVPFRGHFIVAVDGKELCYARDGQYWKLEVIHASGASEPADLGVDAYQMQDGDRVDLVQANA